MKISKELFKKWQRLKSKGDIEKIRQLMPKNQRVSNELVRICVNKGEYKNEAVLEYVDKYYLEKEKRIGHLLE